MSYYSDPSMNRLVESLEATNVLSESYKGRIINLALSAVGEGYGRGEAAANDRCNEEVADDIRAVMADLDIAGRILPCATDRALIRQAHNKLGDAMARLHDLLDGLDIPA